MNTSPTQLPAKPLDPDRPTVAIILAAGKGTRMEGQDLPKVAYPVAGYPMVWWVVQACKGAGIAQCIIVVGYRADDVKNILSDEPNCQFVEQTEQLGTGHATQMAQELIAQQEHSDVVVLPGDGPLIRPQTLTRLIHEHREAKADATLVTSVLTDPTGYGRVIRHADGSFKAIVEHKDATEEQLKVCEINTGYYCFQGNTLFQNLALISNTNAQSEYYLTDVPALIKEDGGVVSIVDRVVPQEVMGVNNKQQLATVDQVLRNRLKQPPAANRPPRESA